MVMVLGVVADLNPNLNRNRNSCNRTTTETKKMKPNFKRKYQNIPKNKFGAIKQTYNGYSYQSKKEAAYAMELDLRVKAKDIKSWDRQHKIELYAYGVKICNYYIDFVITHNDGIKEYVEVKGFETNVWKLKWKLCKAKFKKEQPRDILTLVK